MDRAEKLEYLIEQVGAQKVVEELFCNWLSGDRAKEFFDDMCDQWDIDNPTEEDEESVKTCPNCRYELKTEMREGAGKQLSVSM